MSTRSHRESTWAPALFFTFHSADRQFFQRPFVAGRGGGSERPSPPSPSRSSVYLLVSVRSLCTVSFFCLQKEVSHGLPPSPPHPQPVLLQDEVIIATMTAAFVTLATNDAYSVGALVLAQ